MIRYAIIPARGGSERIPRKNIKLFFGKPAIAWPIKAALDSGCFDKVIVSTDDKEIKSIAEDSGALCHLSDRLICQLRELQPVRDKPCNRYDK